MEELRNVTSTESSRRTFLRLGAGISAALASGFVNESVLAAVEWPKAFPKGAVVIDANENPLGPSAEAREAVAKAAENGGRYSRWLTEDLVEQFAKQEGLKPEYIRAYPGSSLPLHYSVLAFTSPSRSYVTADPGYEAGMYAAKISGARIVKVPLTKSYAHDVKAMTEVPDAGLLYICTPNNPTGTLTSHSDVEYALKNKPKGAILLLDEAYIHFSNGTPALDFVKADQDIVVLRTFSKIYGMAGLRCGYSIARPDLQEKLANFSGWNAMPVTAVQAASVSLSDPQLVPERKQINVRVRAGVFEWLDSRGYRYIPSETNFFMLETNQPAIEIRKALASHDVFVGRVWPSMPSHLRVTIGTGAEMERFQTAFLEVMNGKTPQAKASQGPSRWIELDGVRIPNNRDFSV
ncbi:MAG TPA: pyridoxal phosphate-dependent aminotransferase [Terriglobales bacterium]|nr:pyridoxal phosphate-dependent aminotransferase [Terriglobales bacterium]